MKERRRDIAGEVRQRFEQFIGAQLGAKRDVAKGELAEAFMAAEQTLVGQMGQYFTIEALKRWAEEILKRSVAMRNAPAQLLLPLALADVTLPACYSFRSMANEIRYVQTAKAEKWQVESHLAIQRENVDAVTRRYAEDERVYNTALRVWNEFPHLSLGEALRRLAEADEGAA